MGISPELLTRIFQYGFTTRKDGHGFGLHSSAVAAQELGGSLRSTVRARAGRHVHAGAALPPHLLLMADGEGAARGLFARSRRGGWLPSRSEAGA